MLALVLLLLVSLLAFQGARLRAGRAAGNLAEEAARAGAGQVDRQAAYARGTFIVDPAAAVRQARAYLAAARVGGTVSQVGAHWIRVTVTVHQGLPLSIIGISRISATRTAVADLVTGL